MQTRIVNAANAASVAGQIRSAQIVALDTEFHAENLYYPRLYLTQVHIPGSGTWFLDPLDEATFDEVGAALAETSWAVHAGSQDLRILHRRLGRLPARIVDVQIAAGLAGGGFPTAWGRLLQRFLGVTVPKTETLSDWSRRPLTPAQLAYAADDVERLLPLLDELTARLNDLGRASIFEAACAEAREAAISPDPEDLWRPIAGTSHLTSEQASMIRALVAWREGVARDEDRPARAVLSDGLIKDLARHPPTHADALRANRRFPNAVVKRHGDAILTALQQGRERAALQPPVVIEPESAAFRRLSWLQAWAQVLGHQQGWSPRLVLPDRVLAAAAAKGALPDGWRGDLCGDALAAALAGRHSLSLADDVLLHGSLPT
jgi:ribonuclease D